MTESSFPFAPAEPVGVDETESGRGRGPVLLAGGLAVAVLAAGAFFVLGSGGGDDTEVISAPRKPKPVATAEEAAPAPVEVVPVAATEQVGRNPFRARYVEPKAAAVVAGTTQDGPAPATTTTSGGTSTTGGTGGTSTSTGDGAGSPTAATGTKSVSLLRVDEAGVATFVVTSSADDKPAPAVVSPGEVFATYFRFINHRTSVGPDDAPRQCAKVLVGDALIELCQNESYSVATS